MWQDPIVDDVRRTREQHAAKFGFELWAIYRDLKGQEAASGLSYVTFPPKRVERADSHRLVPAETPTPKIADAAEVQLQ